MGDTVLLACSALEAYIDAAQARVETAYPVVYVDKTHHEQPKEMRLRLMKALGAIYQKYCQQFDQETARMLLDIYFELYLCGCDRHGCGGLQIGEVPEGGGEKCGATPLRPRVCAGQQPDAGKAALRSMEGIVLGPGAGRGAAQ